MDLNILFILVSIGLAGANPAPTATNTHINRIIGGSPVPIEQFPYQVALYHLSGLFLCGGSIIAKNYVLTAAHCIRHLNKGFVRAGTSRSNEGGTLSFISDIISHDFANQLPSELLNDIAILRVEPEFVFDGTKQPIELYNGNLDDAAAKGNTTVVSGYGMTDEMYQGNEKLMAVEVPIVDRETCSNYYEGINIGSVGVDRFCAGAMEGGHSTCYGDSGGPLVMGGRLIGIVSYGYICGLPNYPGVNTNVAYYADWIRENIKEE